jgi:hypothetical protein
MFHKASCAVALVALVFVSAGPSRAQADCQIADAKLEEAIATKPEFRAVANRQMVRDLRSLRDAAFTLWSYGRHTECELLVSTIRELVSTPSMASLGGNDEDEAEKQIEARESKVQRGGARGKRSDKDAKPLLRVEELKIGLRADELIGAEVRSSDDKIIGEVRNVVFGDKNRRDYVIIASGGFFSPGKDSFVVPMQALNVTQDRGSFFVPLTQARMKAVPLMPDQDYQWLLDEAWQTQNNTFFTSRP